MTLGDWLQTAKKVGMTQEAFGRLIGVTQGRVSQIVANGTADLRTALAIEKATDGQVTIRDLLPNERAA